MNSVEQNRNAAAFIVVFLIVLFAVLLPVVQGAKEIGKAIQSRESAVSNILR